MKPWDVISERKRNKGRPVQGTEIVEKRNFYEKHFDQGNGTKRLIHHLGPIHYRPDPQGRPFDFEDIDLTPRDDGDAWVIDKAPFILTIPKNRPIIVYESRENGGRVTVTNRPQVQGPPEFVIDDEFKELRGWWQDGSDKRIAANIRPASIYFETWFDAPGADPTLNWRVGGQPQNEVGRELGGKGDPIEVVGNRVTGRVSRVSDRASRQRQWVYGAEHPLRVR